MDGAWTGHPDQNEIAVGQFPYPNQKFARKSSIEHYPDLRPVPSGVGTLSLNGSRAAVRTVIRYRNGVLNGKGASLLDGYMEDLATDRIYRLMIAQRTINRNKVKLAVAGGDSVPQTPELVSRLFDEELERILNELAPGSDHGEIEKYRQARQISEEMIVHHRFNPK
jgi:malate synthase